ncbi:MAG: tetratricopeptide repeat protein [Candidatus Wallbacteria bacterium]|nr:tetratricopeptide repeat protein [Candidatus Wallbacteria bacterium]
MNERMMMSQNGTHSPCCAVCGDDLRASYTTCPRCRAAHHEDCWAFNDGCAVFGCSSGKPAIGAAPAAPRKWLRAAAGVCMLGAMSASLALWSPPDPAPTTQAKAARTVTVSKSSRDRRIVYYGGPRSLVTYGNLGNAYARSGEYDLAIACYEKVLELDPNFSYGYFNLGNLYYKKGDGDTAVRCYQKALWLDPGMTEAYCNLGIVCQKQGQFDRAIGHFRKALEIDPQYAGTYYSHLGEIAYEKGDASLAMESFARAVAEDSTLAVPKNNLAYLYAERNMKLGEAMTLVDEALAAEPDNAYYLDTKGWICYRQGDLNRAEEYLERAHNRSPDDMEIRGHLVEVWAKLLH